MPKPKKPKQRFSGVTGDQGRIVDAMRDALKTPPASGAAAAPASKPSATARKR